jgi:hypothetical protein
VHAALESLKMLNGSFVQFVDIASLANASVAGHFANRFMPAGSIERPRIIKRRGRVPLRAKACKIGGGS